MPDRRRRRRAGRRDDRARARPPLRPRVARGVAARRADGASARSPRCSRASSSSGRPEHEVERPRLGARDGHRRRCRSASAPGDVVVVGDRAGRPADRDRDRRRAARDQQRQPSRTTRCSRSRASSGTAVVASPLDSYVTGRMITLSAPCRALMDREPLAVAARRPASPTSPRRSRTSTTARRSSSTATAARSASSRARDLVNPPAAPGAARRPRRAGAERARRRAGRDRRDPRPPSHRLDRDARCRCAATFDPVGSTATLVIERFRQSGMEPSRAAADAAARRRAVRHRDPQLADHDRARPRGDRLPRAGARASTPPRFGREMFERHVRPEPRRRPTRSSGATRRSTRPAAARRCASRRSRRSARALSERRDELLEPRSTPCASARATRSSR